MSRRRHVVFAVFGCLLMLTAAPGGAAQTGGTLVVGSQHDTAIEFGQQSLTNLSVEGSGNAGRVVLDSASTTTIDDFEDGDLAEWSGATANYDVTTAAARDGTYGLVHDTASSDTGGITQTFDNDSYTSLSVDLLSPNVSANSRPFTRWYSGGTEAIRLLIDDGSVVGDAGSVIYYDGSSWQDTSINIQSDTWYTLEVRPDYDANTYTIAVSDSNGQIGSFSGASMVTGVSELDTVGIQADNSDAAYQWDNIRAQIGDTIDSAQYVGSHNVSDSESAAINITQASNVSVDAQIRTDGGTTLGSDTITSTGNHTIALSDTSSESLETVLDVTVTGSDPQFELADESILFTNDAPQVDNTTASPTGDISQNNIELSIGVSDPQFSSAQGEELTATFYVDGNSVGTDTLTSNGTASVDYTASAGGAHSWHVVVEDSYGGSTTSDTFEFRAPSELEIRNESNPTQLLDNATVTLQFYGDESTDTPITITRTVSDGTANMSGLPVDQPLVVVASADGYHDRRIFISSLYDQQEIYLLPDDRTVVQPTYVLEDFSGYYPQEDSVLAVQREINGSYQTVVGDYFGATGEFEATLREGVRHRLVITNTETGRSRVLGTTMATDSLEKIVRVLNDEELELVGNEDRAPIVGPTLSTLPAATTDVTITTYANDSKTYDVAITYQNGSVSETLASSTVSGNSSTALNIDLSDRSGGSVWVNISWTTASGNQATKSVEYSVSKVYVGNQSLLDWISIVPGEFGPNADSVTSFISVLLTVLLVGVVAGTARPSPQLLGLVAIAGLASFAVIGWLSYDVLFASTVGYFGIIAIREGL